LFISYIKYGFIKLINVSVREPFPSDKYLFGMLAPELL